MSFLAVIDTNVLVSALITKRDDSPTRTVFRSMFSGEIIPLYHKDILVEYEDVLTRKKFHLNHEIVRRIIAAIRQFGMEVEPSPTGVVLPDNDDRVFYEVAMEKKDDGAYLVTGNMKHYPGQVFIVTPAEMVEIMRIADER